VNPIGGQFAPKPTIFSLQRSVQPVDELEPVELDELLPLATYMHQVNTAAFVHPQAAGSRWDSLISYGSSVKPLGGSLNGVVSMVVRAEPLNDNLNNIEDGTFNSTVNGEGDRLFSSAMNGLVKTNVNGEAPLLNVSALKITLPKAAIW